MTRKTVIKKKKKRIDKNLHPRRKLRKTFLLAVASSGRLSSGSLDFRLSAIELSERNDRSFRGISTEFPRRSSVHDIPPRRLQVRGQDTVRDGERQASWTIVRQTGIRLARVPRPNRLHRVRFPRANFHRSNFFERSILPRCFSLFCSLSFSVGWRKSTSVARLRC